MLPEHSGSLDAPLFDFTLDLVTVKDLMGHVGINMTLRYSHLVPEHKAQAMAKLGAKYDAIKTRPDNHGATVAPELKEAVGDVLQSNLAQNRNVFLVRKGRGLKIVSSVEGLNVARDGIEPPTRDQNRTIKK